LDTGKAIDSVDQIVDAVHDFRLAWPLAVRKIHRCRYDVICRDAKVSRHQPDEAPAEQCGAHE
jgi:hypothetical protein